MQLVQLLRLVKQKRFPAYRTIGSGKTKAGQKNQGRRAYLKKGLGLRKLAILQLVRCWFGIHAKQIGLF
ncbi:MAG TPA: hypothetical protein VIG66_08335 [Noviherbaspirillum sp.]